MIHFRDGANTQYVTGTVLLFMIYSDILAKHHQTVKCGAQEIQPARLMQFAKQQVIFSVPCVVISEIHLLQGLYILISYCMCEIQ
jgi:hypothetical protein